MKHRIRHYVYGFMRRVQLSAVVYMNDENWKKNLLKYKDKRGIMAWMGYWGEHNVDGSSWSSTETNNA